MQDQLEMLIRCILFEPATKQTGKNMKMLLSSCFDITAKYRYKHLKTGTLMDIRCYKNNKYLGKIRLGN